MKQLVLALSIASTTALAQPQLKWQLEGFEHPESVIVIPGSSDYLVSNINGHPGEQDGNGYISRLSADGKWINKHWSVGLDAPKGMAVADGKVYVSDLTQLRVIDLASGEILTSVSESKATFLNDVTVDDEGNVYVSDMMSGAIYRYRDGALTRWLELDGIPHPNGLAVAGGELWIGSWGLGLQADFSTETPGGLYRVELASKTLSAMPGAQQFANIDAVNLHPSGVLTNDWLSGDLYRVTAEGPQVVINLGKSAADFGLDQDRLLVPVMFENRVDVYSLD